MKLKRILPVLLVSILLGSTVPVVEAAPTGKISFPSGQTSVDNILVLSSSAQVSILFKNDAGAAVTDVASTLQYITIAADDLNPSRAEINPLTASWSILDPAMAVRTSGSVTASVDMAAIYSPYSTITTVYEYVWALGQPNSTLIAYTDSSQFNNNLKILRPGETLNLTITEQCKGTVGDSVIWLYFRATEAAYASGSYPTDINTIPSASRTNLYYSVLPGGSTKYWLPLHNSYDPYDLDINTGHSFEQTSWTRMPTTTRFAKANKAVHQEPSGGFHICGLKFDDTNIDGVYQPGLESLINGVTLTLLGADGATKAETYYPGKFTYPPPETNPLVTGENQLTGSYCFNMENIVAGTYTFYVRITEPADRTGTTPQTIGPITLNYPNGPFESLNNNFGNIKTAISTSYTSTVSTGTTVTTGTVLTGFTTTTGTYYVGYTSYTATVYLATTIYSSVPGKVVGGTVAAGSILTALMPILVIGVLAAVLAIFLFKKRQKPHQFC